MVSIHDVKKVPREDWKEVNISKILDAKIIGFCVHPDDDATLAMSRMIKNGLGRVPVLDSGKLVGIVSNKDIMQIIKHKIDLRV
jgi:CBS domain-containing protein